MKDSPRVSVVMGAYRAAATIERAIAAIQAQTYRDFELVVVDSSPDDETARLREQFPGVRFEHSDTRLYCHEARNRGVEVSRGELLACIDADVYARADWLAKLVDTYDRTSQVVVGAIACHGRRLRDRAFHLCKFSKFLPGGAVRRIDTGPTANLLLTRADFLAVGGLRGEKYLADVELGRALESLGRQLTFEPGAVVAHHHTQALAGFLEERCVRGRLFGEMRARRLARKRDVAIYLAVTVLPLRLLKIVAHVTHHAFRARQVGILLITFPLVMLGHAAWLWGETIAYARAIIAQR